MVPEKQPKRQTSSRLPVLPTQGYFSLQKSVRLEQFFWPCYQEGPFSPPPPKKRKESAEYRIATLESADDFPLSVHLRTLERCSAGQFRDPRLKPEAAREGRDESDQDMFSLHAYSFPVQNYPPKVVACEKSGRSASDSAWLHPTHRPLRARCPKRFCKASGAQLELSRVTQ